MRRSHRFEKKKATSASRDVDTGLSDRRSGKKAWFAVVECRNRSGKNFDKTQTTFDTEVVYVASKEYEKHESMRRADGVDMNTYISESGKSHARLGNHSMTVLDSFLACKLLGSSNINAKGRMMVHATTQKLIYNIRKSTLERIFNDTASVPSCSTATKKETVFLACDESPKLRDTASWVGKRRNESWQYQRGRGRDNFKIVGRNSVDAKVIVTTYAIRGYSNHYAEHCSSNPGISGQESSRKEER